MAYTPINWEDSPSTKTPINAENLKHMDEGIAQAHDANRLLEIYKANSIKQKLSGEVITSKDCANVPPLGIKLFGKGTQKIVPGNQLFDASKFETTTIGNFTLTNNGDGSLTFSGEGALTQGVNIRYRLTHEETVKMLKAGKIHLQAGAITYPYLNIALKHVNGHYCGLYNNTVAYNNANITEEMINDETCYLEIVLYGSSGGQSITPVTIKPMLYQDGDGTWEPFVGGESSPNINYPQIPVFHGESGSIEGNLLTKNHADFRNLNYTEKGVTVTGDENGVITLSGTPTISEGYIFTIMKPCNPKSFIIGERYVTNEGVRFVDNGTVYYSTNFVMKESITKISVYLQRNVERYVNGAVTKPILCMEKDNINDWQPYTEQPFTALTPNGLKGIPLGTTIPDAIKNSPIHMSGVYWDKAEGQYYIADTKNENGKNVQRIFKEQLLDYNAYMLDNLSDENSTFFYIGLPRHYSGWGNEFICDIVSPKMNLTNVSFVQNGGWLNPSNPTVLYIRLKKDSGITTLEEFKEYLTNNEVYVTIILPEPIVTAPTQEELDQYNSLVMNYPITNVVNDAGAYMEVEYVADTKLYIEQNYVSIDKYNEHENRIAEIEKAMVNS